MKAGFGTGVAAEAGQPSKTPAFVPPSVAELAKLFPQLEILGLLGQGGMGAVYKARQPVLDRFVALKILPPETASDPGFAERFTREARALARLDHPNIVDVHDFGQSGSYHYFLMEFVDGANLRQIEQAGKLTPREALQIIPQICEALQFAHDEGIIHRDIKPENILVDKRGRVKIADFGIAKILGHDGGGTLTGAKDVVGTPHYMAPEQVEKPQTVDHRADIFSLGVVFYELLTGELPLGKFQPPSRKVQVDVRLDEVVMHALEKEPERRYQHASEVQTDVEAIAHTPQAAAAQKPALPVPSPMPNAWEAALIGIGLTVFIALLVALPTVSASVRPVLAIITIIGLIICLLTLAGWWPAPSFLIPDSGFSGRNLPSRRRPTLLPATAPTGEGIAVSSAEAQRIQQTVRAPAIGLLVTGILNWILIPIAIAMVRWIVPLAWRGPPLHLSNDAINGVFVASLVLCSFMIYAALKMMRLESRGMALVASLAAILVTPGNIIGLPLGVWSLATLARADVKAAFRKARGEGWDIVTWVAFLAFGVLVAYGFQIGGRLIGIAQSNAPQTVASSYGPVMERTLDDFSANQAADGLNLQTGQFESARQTRLNTNAAYLAAASENNHWALVTRRLEFRDLDNEQWNNTSTIDFGGAWPASTVLTKGDGPAAPFYWLPTNAQSPLTFAFLTANGDQGVLQIVGFRENPRGMRIRYKLAKFSGGGGSMAAAGQNVQSKFVRLVVDRTALTFEGQPTSWDDLGALLAKVPDRKHTVLEFAVTTDQITVAQQNEWFQRAAALARQHGFEYASFIGIHPPGSKGNATSLTFGPVIERVVSGEGDTERRFIDFDTGHQFAALEFFDSKAEPSPEETQKWSRQNGIDAVGDTSPAVSGLVGFEMVAVAVPLLEWEMLPTRLDYYLTLAKPGTPITMSAKGDLPVTFVIQTREGGRGLLQITGISNATNTRSVSIRYKLATTSTGTGGGQDPLRASGGGDAAALAQEGWQLWQGGRFSEAIPKFEAAVKLNSTNTAAWNGLGWASFNLGKMTEAEEAFRKVIELEPEHAAALNGLGQLYLAQKNFAAAESQLLKAAPKAPAAWFGLARLYLLQGKFEQAEKWAQNLVDSGQADETVRLMLKAARDRKLPEGLRMVIEPQ